MARFWEKPLHQLTPSEWEALCDGCGKCCLNKLEDWDTGEIYWTNIGCELLNCENGRCKDYQNRFKKVQDCIQLTPENIRTISWLPPTCAYRLIRDGEDLYDWHPLISGDPKTVETAGVSIVGRAVEDAGYQPEDYEEHLVEWPREIYLKKQEIIPNIILCVPKGQML